MGAYCVDVMVKGPDCCACNIRAIIKHRMAAISAATKKGVELEYFIRIKVLGMRNHTIRRAECAAACGYAFNIDDVIAEVRGGLVEYH